MWFVGARRVSRGSTRSARHAGAFVGSGGSGTGVRTSAGHLHWRAEGPKEERARDGQARWRQATSSASSAIHRRNPRPRKVIAPKAGLLAHGSSWWFRPSRASCKGSVTQNGTATHRLQLRGQRRNLPRRASPASRLSPTVMPEAGNLDTMLQQQREQDVKFHIKKSLYGTYRLPGIACGKRLSRLQLNGQQSDVACSELSYISVRASPISHSSNARMMGRSAWIRG